MPSLRTVPGGQRAARRRAESAQGVIHHDRAEAVRDDVDGPATVVSHADELVVESPDDLAVDVAQLLRHFPLGLNVSPAELM